MLRIELMANVCQMALLRGYRDAIAICRMTVKQSSGVIEKADFSAYYIFDSGFCCLAFFSKTDFVTHYIYHLVETET